MKNYQFLLHEETWEKASNYKEQLQAGLTPGRSLQKTLQEHKLSTLSTTELLQALIRTKKPQIFAENQISGDGSDWTLMELSILGDLSVAMPVTVFDNGLHTEPNVYETTFKAHLVFTPGALLRNGRGHIPADWEAVTRAGEIDAEAYNKLYVQRLMPVFQYASDKARQLGRKAFITLPGLGCGQFAGIFRHQLGSYLQRAIEDLLETHGTAFKHLEAVYYDPYQECENKRYSIHGIHYLVRPLTKGNRHKPQLCPPQHYEDDGDDFSNCELFSIVAWDHVSWPGNDFYLGARSTDDGVKAAATDAMRVITDIPGNYDRRTFRYTPPDPYRTWREVVSQQNIQFTLEENLTLYPR